MGLKWTTREKIEKAMKTHTPVKFGNVWTNRVMHPDNATFGRLPQEWRQKLISDIQDNAVYVVYSFQTPIAWTKLDGQDIWTIPDEHYSQTTNAHQSLIKHITR